METGDTQFVVTAPGEEGRVIAYALGARQTLPVIIELIAASKERITIAAPFLYVTPELLEDVLGIAMKAAISRGVRIQIATSRENVGLWKTVCPGEALTNQIEWFCPSEDTKDVSRLVSHAKFVLSDSQRAYLGSANLTVPGLTTQYEMGIEVGGQIAARVGDFWELLVQRGVFINCD